MKIINPKLRQDLNTYKLDFPTDARTKEYKAQIERFKAPELYKLFLQTKVEQAKLKQKEINKQEKKDATKKARAEKKADKNNLKRYIGSIKTKVKIIYKDGEIKYRTKTHMIDIKTTAKNLNNDLMDIINEYRNYIIENESKVDDVIVLKRTDNIQEVNDKIKPLTKIRMKDAGVGIYDGYAGQEWNTNTGRCVFDYIIYRYGNIDGFKKVCNYESLCNIFYNNDDDEEINNCNELLKIGVNTIEIKRFCEKFNIPMYAVDEVENTFLQHIPNNRNKKCPAMIYRLSNTHIHPINDNDKIKSIIKTTSIINNVNSDLIETYKPKKDAKKEGIDEINDDIKDNLENVVFVDDINNTLYEMLKCGIIPDKDITYKDKELVAFKSKGIKYICNKDIELIKELCLNMKVEYKGQGMGTLLIDIIKEALNIEKLPKSSFNPNVYDTLQTARKGRARTGIIDDNFKTYAKDDLMAWDIIKCYSSCMYKPTEDWIRLDFNDIWEDYDNELKLGLYYVKTNDKTLFKQSGYYSTAIIKKAITENIEFEILKQLIPSHKENKDTFTKIIDVVLKYSNGNTKISKTIINLMSGMLGQSSAKVSKKIRINNDIEQIFNFLNKYYELEEGIMIDKIEDTDYYIYGFNKEVIFNENNIPMYIQVLDESNIKLYDMIKTMGGKLVACKVDCAVVKINSKRCTRIDDTEWGGYSTCKVPKMIHNEIINKVDFIGDKSWNDNRFVSVSLNDRERWEDKEQLININGGLLLDYIDDWNNNKHYKLNDSDRWEGIFNLLNRNKGLLLQASAGNGKTYTAKMIASKIGKRVKIIAPTNKASLNIGGSTIHRFLQMNKEGYIKPDKIKFIDDNYDYIIVDEISMISKELWKRLCLVKQQLPHIIFLLLGDEKQTAPVEDEQNIKDYFNHPAVKYICNYNKNILNVRKRYDEKLYNLLEEVDNIDINDKVAYPPLITTRNICYYNKTRIKVNKMWNDKLKHDATDKVFIPKYINSKDADDKYSKQSQDMTIYNGLPVIAMRTKWDKEDGLLFANSETFEVCDFGDDYISVYNERPDENGNKEAYIYNCPIEDFNKYFVMNYCSTTHKAQGETITENFTIYDWEAMNTKLKYTALSRAKKVEQVYFD